MKKISFSTILFVLLQCLVTYFIVTITGTSEFKKDFKKAGKCFLGKVENKKVISKEKALESIADCTDNKEVFYAFSNSFEVCSPQHVVR